MAPTLVVMKAPDREERPSLIRLGRAHLVGEGFTTCRFSGMCHKWHETPTLRNKGPRRVWRPRQ